MKTGSARAIIFLTLCFSTIGFSAEKAKDIDHETDSEWKAVSEKPFSGGESAFHSAMERLLKDYVDTSVTADDLYRAATAGMLASLNSDDHMWNRLLTPEDTAELESTVAGKITGVGIVIKWMAPQGYGLVLNTVPNSPAARAGIQKDDLILTVDNKNFKHGTLRDLVEATRGKMGETVTFKILRGDRTMTVPIKRETVPWAVTTYDEVGAKVGVIAINYFTDQAPALAKGMLLRAQEAGVKKLIVDLRDNSGGSFDAAVQVAGLFVPAGLPIVRLENRRGEMQKVKASGTVLKPDVELIVLINQKTASGAELVTTALRESRGARVVGVNSLGKWNVQTIEPLPNHYALKFTVQRFLSPKGNSYQNQGIEPDIQVELPAGIDIHELEARKEADVRLEKDTQLRAAVGLLK